MTYYGRNIETPLAGEEPQLRGRPMAPTFSDAEAELRPGETAKQYTERLAAIAASTRAQPRAPVIVDGARRRADEVWIEQHALRILAERKIERPTYQQRARANCEAAALLARARWER